MNRKNGFTLVELLGVIAVLAIIALITIPPINRYIINSKQELYEHQIKMIELATKNWGTDNLLLLPTNEGDSIFISLCQLSTGGYLDGNLKNIITNKNFFADMLISITKEKGGYVYQVKENSGSSYICEDPAPTLVVNGETTQYVELGSTYIPVSYQALSIAGDDIPNRVVKTITKDGKTEERVNPYLLGTYTITYSVEDDGKITSLDHTVIVRDTTAPVITLNDSTDDQETTMEASKTYSAPLAKVTDNSLYDNTPYHVICGGDSVVTEDGGACIGVNSLNPKIPGEYEIKYTAKDESNNETTLTYHITVTPDTTAPEIEFTKEIVLTSKNPTFTKEDGVTLTDNVSESEDITLEIDQEVSFDDMDPGTYTITYKATDEAGNFTTKERTITVEKTEYVDGSGANKPDLLKKLIPIKYDGTNWIYADIEQEWYNYDNKEWANAVILTNGETKKVGDTVTEDEIVLWYVWIPRYKYQLFNVNNGSVDEQLINVTFESGTETTGTVSCTTASNGVETCTNAENGNWYTHPAFTFGDQQLTGYWMGKFEVSTTDDDCNKRGSGACDHTMQVEIKPGVKSWMYATIPTYFDSIHETMSTFYPITDGDSHMMKNIEWGAVAYLKQSKYGLGMTDIVINDNTGYLTGGGSGNAYKDNVEQSTTGNIYGIYDMSGGASEYVMGNMLDSDGVAAKVSMGNFETVPDSKYFDVYSYVKYSYDASYYERGHLGDTTKETLKTFGDSSGGWYSDYVGFPSHLHNWFTRGGRSNSGTGAGIFSSGAGFGATNVGGFSTRAVLTRK